jgi:hypothetical protein
MKALKLSMLFLIPAFVLSACGGSDDDSLDDRLDLADPKVRFVHAVPGGPNVTLYRGDTAQSDATNVGYKFASHYFDVSTNTEEWAISTTDASNPVDFATLTLDARRGNKYTLVAVPSADAVDALLIDDPYNKGLTSDRARVRVLNASINAQNVDIYLTEASVDLATVSPNFPAVQYKTAQPASGNDSREFSGGTYQLRITTAGTKDVIFTAPVTLDNNADWLLLSIPEGGLGAFVPDQIKVLVAKSDDSAQTTLEIESQ